MYKIELYNWDLVIGQGKAGNNNVIDFLII